MAFARDLLADDRSGSPGGPDALELLTRRRPVVPDGSFVPLPDPVGELPYRVELDQVIGPDHADAIAPRRKTAGSMCWATAAVTSIRCPSAGWRARSPASSTDRSRRASSTTSATSSTRTGNRTDIARSSGEPMPTTERRSSPCPATTMPIARRFRPAPRWIRSSRRSARTCRRCTTPRSRRRGRRPASPTCTGRSCIRGCGSSGSTRTSPRADSWPEISWPGWSASCGRRRPTRSRSWRCTSRSTRPTSRTDRT